MSSLKAINDKDQYYDLALDDASYKALKFPQDIYDQAHESLVELLEYELGRGYVWSPLVEERKLLAEWQLSELAERSRAQLEEAFERANIELGPTISAIVGGSTQNIGSGFSPIQGPIDQEEFESMMQRFAETIASEKSDLRKALRYVTALVEEYECLCDPIYASFLKRYLGAFDAARNYQAEARERCAQGREEMLGAKKADMAPSPGRAAVASNNGDGIKGADGPLQHVGGDAGESEDLKWMVGAVIIFGTVIVTLTVKRLRNPT
jgi:hypothetical protein